MKILSVTILMLAFMGSMAMAQIATTAHDFSGETWTTNTEICVPCHTPHDADATVSGAPLWNHEVTAATFTLYSTTTLDATISQPSSSSKLCLSCHDGTVALENFGGTTTGTTKLTTAPYGLGIDLGNDHPIGFTYDAALVTADGGLKNPAVSPVLDLLYGGKVECASCHDAHGAGFPSLLVATNAGSALCLTCHDK